MKKLILCFLMFLFLLGCKETDDPTLYHYVRPILQDEKFSFKTSDLYGGVDILFIVDNSGSMGDEQASLQRNFKFFIDEFKKFKFADWRMGLISTDKADPPYLGFSNDSEGPFSNKTPNPELRFIEAVGQLGTYGDASEYVFDNVKRAIDTYPDFVRKRSFLAIVIMTDEEEQSVLTSNQFNDFLLNKKFSKKELVEVHGGFTATDLDLCDSWGWSYSTSEYKKTIDFFGGDHFDLCDLDFGTKLAAIGNKIASKLEYPKILLRADKVPFKCTIEISYKGTILPHGKFDEGGKWFYEKENNAVVFYSLDFVESEDDLIDINYIVDDGHYSPDETCTGLNER